MKQVMQRNAADNAYMHKDFHAALSTAIAYLEERYGAEAVREYLRQFARSFYAPLTADINQRGLLALKEHLEHIYAIEGGDIEITLADDEMTLVVPACPAVSYMRQHERPVAPLFGETGRTVNETICEGTPFAAETLAYDDATGASTTRFVRRQA